MSTIISTAVNTVAFSETALTYNINKLNRETLLPGITKGGLLTRIADNQVSIAPFTALFQMDYGTSPVHKLLVKVYNASSVNVNITASQPYVVMNMSWVREEDNYPIADIKSLAELATLDSSYIIVGEVPFTGSIISNPATFDYTYTTRGFLYNSNPSSRSKLISRVGIEPGTSITEDQDVINKKYLDENTDIGTKPNTQIPFGDGTNIFDFSSDFIWNNSTKRLILNGNINLSSPSSTSDVGNVAYMDTRYFGGSEQTTPNLSDKIPLYDGAYKYLTINTIRNVNVKTITTGTTYVIQTTDPYTDIDFTHSTTTPLLQATLPSVSSNNGKTFRFTNVGTTSGLSQINGDSTNIIFKNNILASIKLTMLGDYIELRSNGTYWIVKHVNINIITNWVNRSDYTNVHLCSAFTYNTKSSGVNLIGEHITEATSNQTAIVLYDSGGTGTSGILYVYNIAVGTGIWTNGRTVTAGNSVTINVNEGGGSSKNIDYNIAHYLGLDIYNFIYTLLVNSSASMTNAVSLVGACASATMGWNLYNIDTNTLLWQTGESGLVGILDSNGSVLQLTSQDWYFSFKLSINF